MAKKKYYVLNENCDNDIYEIELTDEELKGIEKYYDIMDSMKVADTISFPLTEEEYQERVEEEKYLNEDFNEEDLLLSVEN